MKNFINNLTSKNSKTAIGASFVLIASAAGMFYFSIKASEYEHKLVICQSKNAKAKTDSSSDYAKSRRGNFDYKREEDNSSKLTY